ncbi:MAG: monofunctional biosynthetic peptidoglycan transglycosylase [Bryobacteraceae bacterium]
MGKKQSNRKGGRRWIQAAFRLLLFAALALLLAAVFTLVLLRWINPPTTAVQVQRRLEAVLQGRAYEKQYHFMPLSRISPQLQHAVIASEDGRFYQHHGIDWLELRKVLNKSVEKGRLGRGASTITQQLLKNLFLSTSQSLARKGAEFVLAPVAELILPKRRILELYLNVIEWGPGIYGAEAAARHYYGVPAARLSRDQAARLAAILPNPLRWKPHRMDNYAVEILDRMAKMGW